MTLNNGIKVRLDASNGWQATVKDLPLIIGGYPARYYWTEGEVPGYDLVSMDVVGGSTVIFTNELHRQKKPPEDKPTGKKLRGDKYLIIEDYGTPLGVEVSINHVGDCFD